MQFRDLRRQYEYLKDEIDKEILDVINSASFISGKQVEKLEKQLAEFVGVNHCITCGNGTDALNLALMAWNIGAGDAVFVPDFTFLHQEKLLHIMEQCLFLLMYARIPTI